MELIIFFIGYDLAMLLVRVGSPEADAYRITPLWLDVVVLILLLVILLTDKLSKK